MVLYSFPCGLDVIARDRRLAVLLGQIRAGAEQIERLPRVLYLLRVQRRRRRDRRGVTTPC